MKNRFIVLAIALCSVMGVFAKKQVVYVEHFSRVADLGTAWTERVRGAVISSLIYYQHLQIVDVDSQQSLAVEKNRRSDEASIDDETARIGKMKQLGANYVVQGYISNMDVKEIIDKKGKSSYDGVLTYTIKVIDCEMGTLVSTDMFRSDSKNCKNAEDCIQKMLKKIPKHIKGVVTKDFKINSVVLDSDYESKDGKLQKCYINSGENDGVVPGTVFAVKKAIMTVGRISWTEIGEIVVESIVAADLSLCKVKKGAADIYAALEEVISIKENDPNNAHNLIVESKSFK
ncbi:MAG: hypothetical protein J6P37_03330 [Lachnospiraceae bacterium]|nr:hypothetical protein [Lachnospiraceae bacterium]